MPQSLRPRRLPVFSRDNARPEWARRVERLRRSLKFNQTTLGKKLGTSAMNVSRWERGIQEPSARSYIQLGRLVGKPSCKYFWGRAGLHKGDGVWDQPSAKPTKSGLVASALDLLASADGLLTLPLLKVNAGVHGYIGDKRLKFDDLAALNVITAASSCSPTPARITCLRVKGDSMMPLIHHGYMLAVDTSKHRIAELYGKVVVVWHKNHGLTVTRLKRVECRDVLISENPQYGTISMGRGSGWRMVGKVLWWMGESG